MKNAVILFLLLLFNSFFSAQNTGVESLNADEFAEMVSDYSDHCILIDVREQRFYKLNRIVNAIWGGKKEDLKPILDTLNKETPLFIYCDEGKRSEQAGTWIMSLGFTNVYHLKGGIRAWVKNGFPIVKEENE